MLVYYFVDGAYVYFERIAAFKARSGTLFAAGATVFSSGVLPETLKYFFRPRHIPAPTVGEIAHQFCMWIFIGSTVDRFYWLQAQIFGDGTDAATLLKKIFVDQIIFSPILALIVPVSWYLLREVNYSPKAWKAKATPRLLYQRVIPVLGATYAFWPVMLLIIYSMPSLLQFPLFLFANGAYAILMIFIVRRQTANA